MMKPSLPFQAVLGKEQFPNPTASKKKLVRKKKRTRIKPAVRRPGY